MDPHYYGKVEVGGVTIVLEPFREVATLFALIRSEEADPVALADAASAVVERIRTFPPPEMLAWVEFIEALFGPGPRLGEEGVVG